MPTVSLYTGIVKRGLFVEIKKKNMCTMREKQDNNDPQINFCSSFSSTKFSQWK